MSNKPNVQTNMQQNQRIILNYKTLIFLTPSFLAEQEGFVTEATQGVMAVCQTSRVSRT